jgi:outer membrane protein assembly factor BamB
VGSTFGVPIKLAAALAAVFAALLLSTVVVLADNWPNSRNDPGGSGRSAETLLLPLTEVWHSSAPLVEENGVVVANGVAYMTTTNGQLYAFTVATGAVVAGFPVAIGNTYTSPAVDAANGKVYALHGSSLSAFNLNGTGAWSATVGSAGSSYNMGPVVDAGFVYMSAGGTVKKYNSAGALQWSTPGVSNSTQPALSATHVFVNTNSGQIRKYDKTTGAEVIGGGFPIATTSSQAGLAVVNGRIFHKSEQLYAYDANTGATLWTAPIGGTSTYYNSPAVANGVVYVYGWDARLYAFNEATGATMAGFPSVALSTANDRNWSSPAVAGGLVFVGAGTTQRLKVLGAAGTASAGLVLEEHLTFSADPQGFDLCSPVISDGVVFAMLDGGGLYAFVASGVAWTGGAVSINAGAACTSSQTVTLTIDAGSNANVTEMRISENPLFTGAVFEPYATSKAFTLSAGFGTKTVYIQFRASNGQLSNVFNDTISYQASCESAPVVTVTAPDAAASETGPDPGTFRFSRTGSTTAALTVQYTVGGSAVAADYTPALSGSVTIPAGQASADVVITPVDDTAVEGPETVTATITPNAAYTVGTPSAATVTIADNDRSDVVLCNGVPATIVGTEKSDVLRGTAGPDVIVGLGGDDWIDGRGGNDIICGGDGKDTLLGNDGDDLMFGGADDDVMYGGKGYDKMDGEEGGDYVDGGVDDDDLKGSAGDDKLSGGSGIDYCDPGTGVDVVHDCEDGITRPDTDGDGVTDVRDECELTAGTAEFRGCSGIYRWGTDNSTAADRAYVCTNDAVKAGAASLATDPIKWACGPGDAAAHRNAIFVTDDPATITLLGTAKMRVNLRRITPWP